MTPERIAEKAQSGQRRSLDGISSEFANVDSGLGETVALTEIEWSSIDGVLDGAP